MAGFWVSLVYTFFVMLLGIFILGGEKGKGRDKKKAVTVHEQKDIQKQNPTDKKKGIQLVKIIENNSKNEEPQTEINKSEKENNLFVEIQDICTNDKNTQDFNQLNQTNFFEPKKGPIEQISSQSEEILTSELQTSNLNLIDHAIQSSELSESTVFVSKHQKLAVTNNIEEVNVDEKGHEELKVIGEVHEQINLDERVVEEVKADERVVEEIKADVRVYEQLNVNDEVHDEKAILVDEVVHENDVNVNDEVHENDANNSSIRSDENNSTNKLPDSLNDSTNLPIEFKQDNEDSEWHFVSSVQPL